MISTANIFDLHEVFVNELIGDVLLGYLILMLIVIIVCLIYLKLDLNNIILIGIITSSAYFAAYTQLLVIWVFTVFFVAILFYYNAKKVFER